MSCGQTIIGRSSGRCEPDGYEICATVGRIGTKSRLRSRHHSSYAQDSPDEVIASSARFGYGPGSEGRKLGGGDDVMAVAPPNSIGTHRTGGAAGCECAGPEPASPRNANLKPTTGDVMLRLPVFAFSWFFALIISRRRRKWPADPGSAGPRSGP